jgi:putative membrane protein
MNKSTQRVIPILGLSAINVPVIADPTSNYGHHMMGGGAWMGWFAGPLIMIAMLTVVVVIIVVLIRWLGGTGHGVLPTHSQGPSGMTPLNILEERYARGEIDKEEFEERRKVLGTR